MEIQGGTCDCPTTTKSAVSRGKSVIFRSDYSFAILVAADQITKWMAVLHLKKSACKSTY